MVVNNSEAGTARIAKTMPAQLLVAFVAMSASGVPPLIASSSSPTLTTSLPAGSARRPGPCTRARAGSPTNRGADWPAFAVNPVVLDRSRSITVEAEGNVADIRTSDTTI